MKKWACAFVGVMALAPGITWSQEKPEPKAVRLVLPDQFEKQRDLAQLRGNVVVLFYGDRDAMSANKELGQQIHVQFHPTAKGVEPGRASNAPVTPLPGVPQGQRSPDVRVIPVACIGDVPGVIARVVRNQVLRASPEVPVWLDFGDTMHKTFGLTEGEPNLVVIDAWSRVRWKATGQLDAKSYARLIEVIQYLRREAAGLTDQ